MKVLVACEESQRVCQAFRAIGHEAYSCDILPCSGGHPEWHIQGDCLKVINGFCEFNTMDGNQHYIDSKWDIIVAHPPCTYLTVSGNRWFDVDKYGEKAIERINKRKEAFKFFMQFVECNCEHIAIENPIGYVNTHYKKPDQIIQPYYFGDNARKPTCLWLKNLPLLKPTKIVDMGLIIGNMSYGAGACFARDEETGKILAWNDPKTAIIRSKTFPGIAKAMAEQWGNIILKKGDKNGKL